MKSEVNQMKKIVFGIIIILLVSSILCINQNNNTQIGTPICPSPICGTD